MFTASGEIQSELKKLWVRVDLWEHRLYVMNGNKIYKEFVIAVGKEKTPSPIGKWIVKNKSKNWGGGFGSCWLEINVPWGIYGIHGTNRPGSIGFDASAGCIRMLNTDIEKIYEMLPVGTKIIIDGPIFGNEHWKIKKLVQGSRGTLVKLVQNRLLAAGYYSGPQDGIFGLQLEKAVKKFQRDRKMPITGQIAMEEYLEMGLLE